LAPLNRHPEMGSGLLPSEVEPAPRRRPRRKGSSMRQRVIPLLAPMTKHRQNGDSCYQTKARGLAVLNSPLLNKGTAFTSEERKTLGLTGLLPPDISTLGSQVKRAYIQYERLPDALSKNVYLTALHDRNEVLFYRLFSEHLREMIPIVNDLTVGMAMEQYHHECRRPRGVYLSIDHPDAIEEAFANLGVGPGDFGLRGRGERRDVHDSGHVFLHRHGQRRICGRAPRRQRRESDCGSSSSWWSWR